MKRFAAFALAFGLAAVIAVATLAGDSLQWRAQVLALKARGELEFITWPETFRWLLPDSPVYLSNLITGRNPHVALTNTRYVSAADAQRGEQLFRQNCSSCHGGAGEGGNGPPLNVPSRFRSDWALYRTIQQGVPGTSMPPHDMPDPAIWQIITYLATLAPAPEEIVADAGIDIAGAGFDRIRSRDGEMQNWLSYSGGYAGQRFSSLDDIHAGNVRNIALQWVYQSDTTYNKFQTNPLVVDGVMFVTEPQGRVVALDAANGKLLWEFERPIPDREGLVLCCGVANRGVAVLDGRVFVTTIDAHLLALDMRTGRLLWDTTVADYRSGYSITAAPLAINGKVVTGVAGGEMAIRGFVAAFDPANGEPLWRFDTVPEPGAPGSDTWGTAQWEIGGAATWMTGSYDPEHDLIYWGTSHTLHDPDAEIGAHDELFGSSIVALRGTTGELAWHFQATPDDIHGFDAAQIPVLVDMELNGATRQLLFNGNRNGYLYVLDRVTGEFIAGQEFARQSWSDGLDAAGRPQVVPAARPSRNGTLAWPNSVGATNWWPPTFSPATGLLCLPVVDGPSMYYVQDVSYARGKPYVAVVGRQSFNEAASRSVRCLHPADGSLAWEKPLTADAGRSSAITMSGLLSTGGGLLFTADMNDFLALDAGTGAELWRLNTGGRVLASPVSYRANGKQFIAVAAGKALLVFGLPDQP